MKYNAAQLMMFSETAIWNIPDRVEIDFSDNVTLKTTKRKTILSWYMWEMHRRYPGTGINSTHHVGNGRFVKKREQDILGKILWDIYNNAKTQTVQMFWDLSKLVYETVNRIHNLTVTHLSPYVTGSDLGHIADIVTHDTVNDAKIAAMRRIEAGEDGTDVMADTFNIIFSFINSDDPVLRHNGIAKMVRAKLLDKNQILQFIGPRGFVKATDGTMYGLPIYSGYADLLHTMYDSMTESRSASLSLYMNKDALPDSEYFNRKLQLLAETIGAIEGDDCGSTLTIPWLLEKEDIQGLVGKYHMVDGRPVDFKETDTQYIGKIIQIRSITMCRNHNPATICKTCLGKMHITVPPLTNPGHFLTIEPLATLSQLILSSKHVIASIASLYLNIAGIASKWFRLDNTNKSSVILKRPVPSNGYAIRFASYEAGGLNSLGGCDNPGSLLPQRLSCLSQLQICPLDIDGGLKGEWDTVHTEVGGVGSALSTDVLVAIKQNGFIIDGNTIIVKLYDFKDKEILVTPRRSEDMILYLRQVKHFILGSDDSTDKKSKKYKGDSLVRYTDPGKAVAALKRIFDEKITVNLVHAEIFVKACMVQFDPNNPDDNTCYNLPRGGEPFVFKKAADIIFNRSITGALAYQGQNKVICNPRSYLVKDRHNHPLDSIIH